MSKRRRPDTVTRERVRRAEAKARITCKAEHAPKEVTLRFVAAARRGAMLPDAVRHTGWREEFAGMRCKFRACRPPLIHDLEAPIRLLDAINNHPQHPLNSPMAEAVAAGEVVFVLDQNDYLGYVMYQEIILNLQVDQPERYNTPAVEFDVQHLMNRFEAGDQMEVRLLGLPYGMAKYVWEEYIAPAAEDRASRPVELPPVPPDQAMVIVLAGDCTWLTYLSDIELRPAE